MQPVITVETGPEGVLMAKVDTQWMSTGMLPMDRLSSWVQDLARDTRVDGSRFVNSEALLDLAHDRLCGKRKAIIHTLLRRARTAEPGTPSSTPQSLQARDDDLLQGCAALIALSGHCTVGPSPASKVRSRGRACSFVLC